MRTAPLRLAVLAVGLIIAGLLCGQGQRGLQARSGYLWSGACGSGGHDQPVNIIFAGVTSGGELLTEFATNLPGWDYDDGSVFNFSQDDGTCSPQDYQRADGPDVCMCGRDHIRFKLGHAPHPTYGEYYLGAAHYDSLAYCVVRGYPHHEGASFNAVRDAIVAAFQAAGHLVNWINVGNTQPASQPCTSDAGDGRVAVIWIHPPVETPTPMPTHMPTYTPTPPRTPTPTPQGVRGDVNCDHSVTAVDASLILQLDAGIIHALLCPQNGDVNRDGRVNSVDASLILQFIAGLIANLPAGAPLAHSS